MKNSFFVSRIKTTIINNYSFINSYNSFKVKNRLKNEKLNWEDQIIRIINSNSNLLFGRLGGIEAMCLGIYHDFKSGRKHPIRFLIAKLMYNKRFKQLCNNAGVYPKSKEIFNFFCQEHINSLNKLDIFSVWGKPNAWIESNYTDKKEITFVSGDASFPWLDSRDGVTEAGWGIAFAGKRVLVVSPFIDSIKIQVPKLNKIFEGIPIPEIAFQYLRAPLSQGGKDDGKSYKFHLLTLKNQIKLFDFDIALVSAGAYSLPLAAYAKDLGKIGIHAGGALQLFFGITGKRYDDYAIVRKFINPEWKRPFEHERPPNWRTIEDGCYW